MTCENCTFWKIDGRGPFGLCVHPAMEIKFTPYRAVPDRLKKLGVTLDQYNARSAPAPVPMTGFDYSCDNFVETNK